MFKGLITALATPFDNQGNLDIESFNKLLKFQKQSGANGVVVAGSTGEGPTVTDAEFEEMLGNAEAFQAENFKIIAAVGTNNTESTIQKANKAEKYGVDGLLVVAPYYNKPRPHSLFEHYKAINDAVYTPIILYNIPARNGVDMKPDLCERLFELSNVIGIKDSTANLARPLYFADREDIIQLSGDDHTMIAYNAMGGVGVISATSNVIPEIFVKIQELTANDRYKEALKLQSEYLAIFDGICIDTNPIPLKYMLYKLGIFKTAKVRLPLTELSDNLKQEIDQILDDLSIKIKAA